MSPPTPPHPLEGHCSIIFNNTLYVYSPQAFQSLSLAKGAEWKQELMGVPLTGATCNQGWVEGNSARPALFVVGGSTTSPSKQYPGLQRYSFLDKTWDTITPIVNVTQNRQHHGSAFLNQTSSLVVYAGSQDGITGPSTQTFFISTVAPYGVMAYESSAPPVVDPIVMPWSDSQAVMVGGDPSNTQVFLFSPTSGWQDAGMSLVAGIPNITQASCSLMSLDDGSKVLETYDMSQSPNNVSQIVLLNPGGVPAPTGQTIGADPSSSTSSSTKSKSRKRKRDLTLSDFPQYNNTLASDTTRNGFSLAQGANGLVVISGGSTNADDSLCIFNQTNNGWLNATQLLGSQSNTISIGGATPTASATGSPTSSATSHKSSDDNKNHALVILGGVLGAIFGIAALCIVALLVLRWLRKRKQGQHKRRTSDYPQDVKPARRDTSFSFHAAQEQEPDQSTQPFSSAGVPMARGPVPSVTDDAAFFKEIENQSRNAPFRPNQSFGPPAMGGKSRPLISQPMPSETRTEAESKISAPSSGAADASSGEIDPSLNQTANRKTDEGWSKYFQGNNAVNLADQRSTYESHASQPDYRGSAWPDASHATAPLSPRTSRLRDASEPQMRRGNVPFGSPSLEHAPNSMGGALAVSEGVPGKISNAESISTGISDEDGEEHNEDAVDYDKIGDAYSSGIPASIHDDQKWSAVGGGYRNTNRSSSTYTPSYYGGQRDTTISDFPMPASNRPVTRWPAEDGAPRPALPAPITNRVPPPRPLRPSQTQNKEEMRDYFGNNPGRTHTPSDMSWLNLGNNK